MATRQQTTRTRDAISRRVGWRQPAFLVAVLLSQAAPIDRVVAQQRRYSPRTPTVSPNLNLTRTNFDALPNYYSLVRPQLDQNQVNREQQQFNQREMALRQSQGVELGRITQSIQTGAVTAGPTGTGGGFQRSSTKYRFRDAGGYFQSQASGPIPAAGSAPPVGAVSAQGAVSRQGAPRPRRSR